MSATMTAATAIRLTSMQFLHTAGDREMGGEDEKSSRKEDTRMVETSKEQIKAILPLLLTCLPRPELDLSMFVTPSKE